MENQLRRNLRWADKAFTGMQQDWLSKCSGVFQTEALIERTTADEMAEACLENVDGDLTEDPIDTAREEMSCWTND